ncbi:hypothetical protein H5V45_12535 [Nocardioides sp. KIGAM211]|uniref:Uncharacterized protein n=1 Tax=Nocardioides luti TaxID=2761101 RepID=A0A7X0RJE1_9ACTN|nr:hypothetical protein [Nocardioides luti]MBB6628148.1 hypothetical protein [Nocardioides luti]
MSTTTTAPDVAGPGAAARTWNRPRWAAIGVLLVLGAVGAAWWSASSSAIDEVEVTTRTPQCTGTSLTHRATAPTIDAVAGMRCTFTVEVRNGSGRDVDLARAVVPGGAQDTGAVVRVASIAGRTPDSDPASINGFAPLDHRLASGDSFTFDIVLVFKPSGCNAGTTASLGDWPQVEVRSWGRTVSRPSSGELRFHRKGTTPGCRS